MTNHKRLLLALLPLALLAVLIAPATAWAQSGEFVFDENDTLTQEQFSALESKAASYAKQYNVGVYLLFNDSMGEGEDSAYGRNDFARSYYDIHDLGLDTGNEGILFVVSVQSRKYVTLKHFADSSKDPFSDDSVDELESDAKDYLSDNEWYKAGNVYYEDVGKYLSYFAENGKQWTQPHVMGTLLKLGATFIIPLLIAVGVVQNERNAMLTARMQTQADRYANANGLSLRVQTDDFVDRTMSVVPIPKKSDNDGGGWSDMGGGYSGSGGGDF